MKSPYGDKCSICGKRVYDMEKKDKGLKICPLCDALTCAPCEEKSRKERGDVYPCCGKDWIKTK